MVGGVADWFAVTALFRRPLGLPIPHTALIVERKDQFAATLGQFVQENFLNAEVLTERIRAAGIVPRLAAWLAERGQRGRAGRARRQPGRDRGRGAPRRGRPAGADRRADPRGQRRRGGAAGRPGAAGGHRGRPPRRAVQLHRVRRRPLSRRPLRGPARAVPGRGAAVDTVRALPAGLRPPLHPAAAAAGGDGRRSRDATRQQFEAWIAGLPDRLETDPELRERGERFKRDVLGSPGLRDWSSSLWQHLKDALRVQAADPQSELRRQLAGAMTAAGRRLGSDRRLRTAWSA